MLRVGLTGGIACGKSLIATLFRERGIPVINDDDAARDAVAPGSPALAEIVAAFGREVLLPDGALDRVKLGRTVFGDEALRRRLMAITFPHIGRLVGERIRAAERSGAPMLVYESALLVENGQADAWRPLIVVRATPEQQVDRQVVRNGLSGDEALARIGAQMPLEHKVALADFVIDNSGTREETRRQFDSVFGALLARAGGRAVDLR